MSVCGLEEVSGNLIQYSYPASGVDCEAQRSEDHVYSGCAVGAAGSRQRGWAAVGRHRIPQLHWRMRRVDLHLLRGLESRFWVSRGTVHASLCQLDAVPEIPWEERC